MCIRDRNPNQPITPEEIAKEVIDSYKEGASMWHVHTRDEKGFGSSDPELFKKVEDLIFKECPDIVTSISPWADFTKKGSGIIRPLVDPLIEFGHKYCELAVITPISATVASFTTTVNEETLVDTVTYLQDKGVKPEFMGHNYQAIEDIKNWLIKPGILKKPYFINVAMGMHHSAPTTPDPWGLINLITMINMLPDDTVKGANIGGFIKVADSMLDQGVV